MYLHISTQVNVNVGGMSLGVVHILQNQPRGFSKCLRLITGGGGGGGLPVDYVIIFLITFPYVSF